VAWNPPKPAVPRLNTMSITTILRASVSPAYAGPIVCFASAIDSATSSLNHSEICAALSFCPTR
jgi:hypothetical protein